MSGIKVRFSLLMKLCEQGAEHLSSTTEIRHLPLFFTVEIPKASKSSNALEVRIRSTSLLFTATRRSSLNTNLHAG